MGRTLWYELHSPRPLTRGEHAEIRAAVAVMNLRCTWSCEELSLLPLDSRERDTYAAEPPGEMPPEFRGATKVAFDDWNAMLVAAFCRWLSRRMSDVTIRLRDEGRFIRGHVVLIRAGAFAPDDGYVQRRRAELVEGGFGYALAQFDKAVRDVSGGQVFADVSAWAYRERKEIAELGIPEATLRELSLSEVASRLPIPWFCNCFDDV